MSLFSAIMASSSKDVAAVADLCATVTLEEEECGLEVDGAVVEGTQEDYQWCLVGRFLTDRQINTTAMKNTMASIWRPVKGVCIKDLGPSLFMFQFFHKLDLERVINGSPWTFDQHLLITCRLTKGSIPSQIPLFMVDIWIQVYDLPCGFMSERVAMEIGNFIGRFVEADANNFDGVWRTYMRIRVSIDVRKSLKRRMKIKKSGGEWVWVTFKYERLPTFCFFCGILGHGERFCEKIYECADIPIEKPFGVWLRAPNRRTPAQVGERWLRTTGPMGTAAEAASEVDERGGKTVTEFLGKTAGGMEMELLIGDNSGQLRDSGDLNYPFLRQLRDSGDLNFPILPTTVSGELASLSPIEGIVMLDPKRRRLEDFPGAVMEQVQETGLGPEGVFLGKPGSKKLQLVGAGLQTRQAL